jgi:hypothetical protein
MYFKKLTKRLKSADFIQFLKYGIGEVVLLVIGILIALQINNWNENRKAENEQRAILSVVASDLETDIAQAKTLLNAFETKLGLIESSIDSFLNEGQYPTNPLSVGLHTNYADFNLNTRGIELLRKLPSNQLENDSSIQSINTFYRNAEAMNKIISEMLNKSTQEALMQYRTQFSWYPDMLEGRLTEQMIPDVFSNQKCVNQIAHYKMLLKNNYKPFLTNFLTSAQQLQNNLPYKNETH